MNLNEEELFENTNFSISNPRREYHLEAVKQNGLSLQNASSEIRKDKEVVLEAVKQNGISLQYASEELRNNKEVVFEAMRRYGTLEYASSELRNNKEVVLEAVKQNGRSLQYASEELRNNKDFVLEAVKQSGLSLQYTSSEIRKDKEVVLEAVKQNGISLQYASEELRNNKEVVLEAMRRYGTLEYASSELRNDKEFVLKLVKQCGSSLKYASVKIQNDEELLLEAIKHNGRSLEFASQEIRNNREVVLGAVKQDGYSLKFASLELRNDKEVVLEAVKQYKSSERLQFASLELRNDKEVVLIAVKHNGRSLQYASLDLRNDKEVVLEAIRGYGEIKHASPEIQNDKNFVHKANKIKKRIESSLRFARPLKIRNDKESVLKAVKQNGSSLWYASPELRNDKEVVIEALKEDGESLEYASLELRNDKELVLEAVKQDGRSLEYASPRLRNDKEVVLKSVKQNGHSFQYASLEIRNDKVLVLNIVKQKGHSLQYASEELRNDKEVVLEAVKQNEYSLQYASEELRNDKEVVLGAVKQGGYSLKFASLELQNDKEVVLKAVKRKEVKQYGLSLQYASLELRNDKEVVLKAVNQDGSSLQYASSGLRNDFEFLLQAFRIQYDWSKESLQHCSPELRNDRNFFIEVVKRKNFSFCLDLNQKFQSDFIVFLVSINEDFENLKFFSSELRQFLSNMKLRDGLINLVKVHFSNVVTERIERDFFLDAIKLEGLTLKFANDKLRSDKEIVLEAVKQNGLSLKYASDDLRNDKDVVLEAIKQSTIALKFASSEIKNEESIIAEACRKDPSAIKYVGYAESLCSNVEFQDGEFERLLDRKEGTVKNDVLLKEILKKDEKIMDISEFGKYFTLDAEEEIETKRKMFKGVRFENLEIFRLLGSGVYGRAYLCGIKGVEGIYVVKIYKLSYLYTKKLKEVTSKDGLILQYHKNVASILATSIDEKIDLESLPDYETIWKNQLGKRKKFVKGGMVMMKYYRRNLYSFLEDKPIIEWNTVTKMMIGITEGAKHLHDNMIVHRDIHPGNIFVDPICGGIWLGDFGCSLDLRRNFDENGRPSFLVSKKDEQMFSFTCATNFKSEFNTDNGFCVWGCKKMIPPEIINFDSESDDFLDFEMSDLYTVGMIGLILVSHIKEQNLPQTEYLKKVFQDFTLDDPKKRIRWDYAVSTISNVIVAEEDLNEKPFNFNDDFDMSVFKKE